ncbi:choice-of-anchor B family protein [Brumimicrobium aurantiacum]|uniref:Choice-of-anchor B family protein n=1 Tax=Brumimicrobium aurantiacum TaxID=1737063 RepID=A0A3E1EW72_9FLAO|nr:choice-of-anchor B family protein [Brumimicrobium aurantiacum]RFC53805.1 choice-of-anchor B family protein [Brumimicrobium aurantiacum]
MKILSLLFLFITFNVFAQDYNLDSLSHVDYDALHSTKLNDVWGYTDENGNEYALVGARKGVGIVDISDPANPVEVYWHQGSTSVWRDIKTYGDYAYVTTEENDGLLIIDMSPLPNNPIVDVTNYYSSTSYWTSAHNLYIDENGYAYIFGANRGNGGAIILDVFTNPMAPIEVGSFDDWYIHDGYVVEDTLYAAHVNDGFFTIIDVTDKMNPVVLGSKVTPSSFAHNIWPTEDRKYVFTTDEVSRAFLAAYDVSDPSNIVEVDRIQSSPGSEVVPHNAHVNGDFLYTSYYADGIVIHDISDPENMVEVGRYDTYPGTADNTIGNWGAFPFFNSGTIIATDIDNGLFILGPNFDYASKVNGTITDANTGNPIQGAEVTILGDVQNEFSKIDGSYKTGIGIAGSYTVRYEKYGYVPQEISLNLTSGVSVQQDVQLVPLPQYNITINVVDELNNPVLGANVKIKHEGVVFEMLTNGLGEVNQNVSYEDTFFVAVGQWGKITECREAVFSETNNSLTLTLKEGYMDDFTFDFEWSTTSTAQMGDWERAVPFNNIEPGFQTSPDGDSPNDCGESSYVTGNELENVVYEGEVTLISPVFDLTSYSDPFLNYERWFFCYHGYEIFNDTLRVAISNGTEIVEIDKQGSVFSELGVWTPKSFRVSDHITPTSTMQIFIQTSNYDATNNITNAGFDNFYITNESPLYTEYLNQEESNIRIYPNPFENVFIIEGVEEETTQVKLYSLDGKALPFSSSYDGGKMYINGAKLPKGSYFLHINEEVFTIIK